MRHSALLGIILALVIVALAACSTTPTPITPAAQANPLLPTKSPEAAVSTKVPAATPTPAPTQAPNPTSTPEPTATLTPTLSQTEPVFHEPHFFTIPSNVSCFTKIAGKAYFQGILHIRVLSNFGYPE